MPIVNLMHKKLLEERYLHADETTVQVLHEKDEAIPLTPICGYIAPDSIVNTLYGYSNINLEGVAATHRNF